MKGKETTHWSGNLPSFRVHVGKLENSEDRVHLVVADNASNMKRAMKEGQFEAQGCFAHTLQLVVNDGVLSQRAD